MIQIEGLCKNYGNLRVLQNISLDVRKGDIISIIGPSGTGKSTLLRCLNLLEQPSSGSIHVDGINLLDTKTHIPAIRQRMNMVFQSFNLFAHLSVLDNLSIGPVKLLKKSRAKAEQEAMDYLKLVGLAEKAQYYPDELSGGQKQRVAIARCLAMQPEIILFDEPTSALDPTMVSEVLAVIRRLAKEGLTMLIVTHEMDFARDVSTRVLYMDEGGIYEAGTPAQIFDAPQRPKTRTFINRIRRFNYQINGPDYDLYAMNAEIVAFCEKQILSKGIYQKVLLLVEELLLLHKDRLQLAPLNISIAHAEKQNALEILLEQTGDAYNPLAAAKTEEDLSLRIITGLATSISYEYQADTNRIGLMLQNQKHS